MSEPKPIRWSPHAAQRLSEHKLNPAEVVETIRSPQFSVASSPGRWVLMRLHRHPSLPQDTLIHVAIEETPDEIVVLTPHRISKLRKYLKGLIP